MSCDNDTRSLLTRTVSSARAPTPVRVAPIATIFAHYLQPLLAWFTQHIFARLLSHNKEHPPV